MEPGDTKIAPGDELSVNIESDDIESIAIFNKQQIKTGSDNISIIGNSGNVNSNNVTSGNIYYVDNDGNIKMPIIGKVNVAGLTRFEIERLIASLIYPQYVKQEPLVNVHINNFKITVLGDVVSPGIIDVQSDKINILELLARAGDLSITGRRDNIMLIRTNNDGSRETFRYNLNDKYLLLSPYFYLKQNDFIYVEQNRSKARSAFTMPSVVTFGMGLLSTALSVTTLVMTITGRY
ncbi:MAG: polysaccharide biosynthesis/export family protein [Bacteroidales bacterium]